MLADRPLGSLTQHDLMLLADSAEREGARLEYKRDIYTWNDEGTREFLADVSSFANGQGGVLLIGIAEEDGCAKEVVDIQGDIDTELQRLDAKLQSGVEPRLRGIEMRAIPLESGRNVLAIRVVQSWARPHMVTFKNLSRFYSRNSSGKYQLDVAEIRSHVLGAEAIADRIRAFRIDRIARVISGPTELPLEPGAKLIIHAVPFASLTPGTFVEMPDLTATNAMRAPIMSAGYSWRHNFDGLLTYTNPRDEYISTYVQLFRTGVIEALDARLLRPWDEKKHIASTKFESEVLQAIARYSQLISYVGLTPPIAWMLTLTGVKDYFMAAGSSFQGELIDRDVLQVPEVIQEDFAMNYASIGRRLIDPIWQAAGWERSPNFDDGGNWKARQ